MIIPEDGCLPKITRSGLGPFNNVMIIKVPEQFRKPGETIYQLATLDRSKKGESWPADKYLDCSDPDNEDTNVPESEEKLPKSKPNNRNVFLPQKAKSLPREPKYINKIPLIKEVPKKDCDIDPWLPGVMLNNSSVILPTQSVNKQYGYSVGLLGERPKDYYFDKDRNVKPSTSENTFHEGMFRSPIQENRHPLDYKNISADVYDNTAMGAHTDEHSVRFPFPSTHINHRDSLNGPYKNKYKSYGNETDFVPYGVSDIVPNTAYSEPHRMGPYGKYPTGTSEAISASRQLVFHSDQTISRNYRGKYQKPGFSRGLRKNSFRGSFPRPNRSRSSALNYSEQQGEQLFNNKFSEAPQNISPDFDCYENNYRGNNETRVKLFDDRKFERTNGNTSRNFERTNDNTSRNFERTNDNTSKNIHQNEKSYESCESNNTFPNNNYNRSYSQYDRPQDFRTDNSNRNFKKPGVFTERFRHKNQRRPWRQYNATDSSGIGRNNFTRVRGNKRPPFPQ